MPAPADDDAMNHLRSGIAELTAAFTVVGERMPASLWGVLARPRSSDALVEGIRRAFDPDGIMNTGILGDA